MEERESYLDRELDLIFREWSAKTALLGAILCLALSPMDFSSNPAHAVRFLGYRVAVALALLADAALIRRAPTRAQAHALVFAGVLASSLAIEAMILTFGGHHSPYLLGLVLMAIAVLGLVPAGPAFASLLAATIFLVYLAPILLWETISERQYFAVETTLFAIVLATGVLVRWFHRRHLERELSLRHELTQSRERLEREVEGHERTAAELRESRDLLSSIAVAAMDAIVMIDPGGAIRFWNPAAAAIFGYTAAETIGRGPFTFLADPEKQEALLAEFRAWQASTVNPGAGKRLVTRGRRRDGSTFPMELAMSPVQRDGRPWTCVLLRDVTERARSEERLRLFAAAIEGAVEGFYIMGLDGRIIYVNQAVRSISGREPESYIGRSVTELHQDPAKATGVILPAILRSGSWSGEVLGKTKDGRPLALWLTASLVRDDAGRPIAMVGITKDLSAQKRLEEERIKTQKLESIGVLAGGLAHDFNNLLTIILGNLDLARLFAGESPDAAEALDHAAEAALRAGDLTRQLITFSKGGQPVKRVGSIARTIRDTVVFAAAGSNISCVFDLPENLPAIEFDEGQIRQVIHNLVQNAREAMPGGGVLRVGAGARRLEDGEIPGLPAGCYLRLEFSDRGSGIAGAHLSRIFDPYFSTKEMDTVKGRGLGLAVSFSIVRSHGGTITADSVIGQGTTIAIYLPETTRERDEEDEEERPPEAAAEPPAAPALEAEPVPEQPPKGRVLVMDDEPLVLEMAGAMLRRLGFASTLARSGAEAIVQYQIAFDSGRRFDAAILDLTVPGGMGGPETLARLREIDPAVQAALSSGYTDHPAVADWSGGGFAAFIAKPYSLRAFEEVLGRLV